MSVPGVVSPAADRLYCPPPRRHLLNKQHHQHQSPPADRAPERPAKPTPEPELRRDTPPSLPALTPPPASTNLESFIASTAVRVPARRLPQASARGATTSSRICGRRSGSGARTAPACRCYSTARTVWCSTTCRSFQQSSCTGHRPQARVLLAVECELRNTDMWGRHLVSVSEWCRAQMWC